MCWKWKWSRSVMSDSLQPYGLKPTSLLCPLIFPGKNTGECCHFLLQVIVLTQELNPRLLHWQADSLPLNREAQEYDILIPHYKRFRFSQVKVRLSQQCTVCVWPSGSTLPCPLGLGGQEKLTWMCWSACCLLCWVITSLVSDLGVVFSACIREKRGKLTCSLANGMKSQTLCCCSWESEARAGILIQNQRLWSWQYSKYLQSAAFPKACFLTAWKQSSSFK